jgi:hypothetical protein
MTDKIPGWCYNGGSFRFGKEPAKWRQKTSGNNKGQWVKKELIPYGKANAGYRQKYYRCPDCGCDLLPMEKGYRFCCSECRLIFAYGFGSLYGFGGDSNRAEYDE